MKCSPAIMCTVSFTRDLMNPLLDIKNLRTYFFTPEGIVHAVEDVSFSIPKGVCLGVLGESGCGKSVTALSIMRLITDPPGKIVSGTIQLDGRDLLSLTKPEMRQIRGRTISMIFQEPMTSLNPAYTVGNQISETYITHQKMSPKDSLGQSIEMLKLVGIPAPEKRVHDYPHQLSGGMRQRAMIAMAVACRPRLLIADEPTTALDVTIQAQILDLLAELQEELGMSIMMITHDLGVIAEISRQVVVMYAGQVVEYAPIDTLFEAAQHPYTMGLMRSIPVLGDKFRHGKQPLQEIKGMVPNLIRLPKGCVFAPRCSEVMAGCHEERPPMYTINSHHGARCWLMEKKQLTVEE